MAQQKTKQGPSKYKYVRQLSPRTNKTYWSITLPNVTNKTYDTERDAAIAVDKYLISKGKKPLNILVRKI